MSSYKSRLDNLRKSWETEKPATGGGALPPGKYQFQIKRAVLEESKANFNKGHLQVTYELAVATGPMKGRKAFIRTDLEMPADPKSNRPSGMAIFKGHLKNLEVNEPKQLTEKSISELLKGMVGIVANGQAVLGKTGYTNIYLNDLVNAPAEADDDEDEVEDEDDEDSEDESDDESEDDESEDEDEDEDSDDDDEDDEDDDEEEAPPAKPSKNTKAPAPQAKKGAAEALTGKQKPAKKEAKADDGDEWDEEFDKA